MLIGKPKIFSRGFIFEKDEGRLYIQAEDMIEDVFKIKNDKAFDQGKMQYDVIKNLEDKHEAGCWKAARPG